MSSIRKKRNFKGLALAESPLSTPSPSTGPTTGATTGASGLTSAEPTTSGAASGTQAAKLRTVAAGDVDPSSGANYHNKLSEQLANLELGIEYKLDLKNEDLKHLSELGAGNGGTVSRVSR